MELKYQERIGQGAFGDVWLATDTLGRSVAVKFFNDASPTQAEQSAIAHAKALVRVDSAAVVRVYAVERQRNPETRAICLAIVMEYVPGPSLQKYTSRLSTQHARTVIRDISTAVEAIHSAGLVHGDLHAGNVVITSSGAKVVDIFYSHSLAEVGARTAAQTRDDDLRCLAGVLRQVAEKSVADRRSLAEAYFQATTSTTSARNIEELFAALLPQASSSTVVTRRALQTNINQMTEGDFSALLASVDDAADHHILWVTRRGEVRLSPVGDNTPAGFEEKHEAEMQFRWETFQRGNEYCGADAAADSEYVASKLKELKRDWSMGKTGYVDF